MLGRVAGSSVCHTDLRFIYESTRTVKSPPLTLGHEISSVVEDAGANCREFTGTAVIVPAVLPGAECALCHKGRGTNCRQQKMPGNHLDGGFATHVVVPWRYLCQVSVPDEFTALGNPGVTLREPAVIADAVTTPYQTIKNDISPKARLGSSSAWAAQAAWVCKLPKCLLSRSWRLTLISASLLLQFGADLTLNLKALEENAKRRTF